MHESVVILTVVYGYETWSLSVLEGEKNVSKNLYEASEVVIVWGIH